jgi:hypothetical protein
LSLLSKTIKNLFTCKFSILLTRKNRNIDHCVFSLE